jgi:hypothetical protein
MASLPEMKSGVPQGKSLFLTPPASIAHSVWLPIFNLARDPISILCCEEVGVIPHSFVSFWSAISLG